LHVVFVGRSYRRAAVKAPALLTAGERFDYEGVIASGAAFQAERGISRGLQGLVRARSLRPRLRRPRLKAEGLPKSAGVRDDAAVDWSDE